MERNKLWRPAIEFNLTEHCNLHCAYCDHASSMLPPKFADLESFTHDIEMLSTVLHAGEFKFAGGEPLLHPQLLDFLRIAKRVQIANRIVLITNGVLLHKAPNELWDLIDGMWISVYPGVKHRFDWDWIQQIADKYEIFVLRKITPRFIKSALTEEIQCDDFVEMIFQNCDSAHFSSCHTVYEGRYYLCEPSVWAEKRLSLHGITFVDNEGDSVPIHGNPNLHAELDELIRKQEPLKACRYCLGGWAKSTPHEQLSRSGIAEFIARRPDELADLVTPLMIIPRPYTQQNRE